MRSSVILLLSICCILVLFSTLISANDLGSYQYVSPKPNSLMVSNKTNIILRNAGNLDESTINPNLIRVVGSKSGSHSGDFILSDDQKTIVFNPHTPFAPDEVVSVTVQSGVKRFDGVEISEYSFTFKTAPSGIVQRYENVFGDDNYFPDNLSSKSYEDNVITASLPAPPIQIDSVNNPGSGYIFMATWDRNVPALYGNFIFILDSSGVIVDSVRVKGAPFDFQVQSNGLLSYALGDFSINVPLPGEELQHIVLDNTLAVVDSFKMKNGYITDFHEFKMLPNGHVMMMSYHTIIYDMSTIVEGGKTDASLVINIMQEQDLNKNVVFEWRNIDYIPITDSDLDLTASRINYGTLNAFDIDDDGNILTSWRNHSEIMKINRATGEVMWRMGGPRGEFTFVGEHEENAPYYHARQHNIRRRPNGNITMFDNGQFHTPPYSRAVEYSLDEVNKVATLVSEWRYPNGNIFCVTAGNAEPLSNGGWFSGYGVPSPQFVKRNAVEVHPDGSIALEFSLPNGVLAYRAYKLPWKESVSKPSFTHFEVKEGNTYSFNNESITTGIEITYIVLPSPDYNEAKITRLPYGPVQPQFIDDIIAVSPVSIIYEGFAINTQTAEFHIDLAQYPEIKNPRKTAVFRREFPNQGLFIMLSTSYDSSANELITTTTGFGEFVFGETDLVYAPQAPLPYEPSNGKKVLAEESLTLRWTGQGFYNLFQVQVSTDSSFSTTLKDTSLNSSLVWLDTVSEGNVYYWRVRARLSSENGDWSSVWKFEPTEAFITILSPDGGEELSQGEATIIRWETNISDSVRIDLYQGIDSVWTVGDALGNLSAFEWEISTDLLSDSSYKIQITSIEDSSITDMSNANFSLTGPSEIETISHDIPNSYSLFQNYPNPFNPSTRIKFSLPSAQNVKIELFTTLGQRIEILLNKPMSAGSHEIEFNAMNLPSGIYYYSIKAGEFQDVKKMVLIK